MCVFLVRIEVEGEGEGVKVRGNTGLRWLNLPSHIFLSSPFLWADTYPYLKPNSHSNPHSITQTQTITITLTLTGLLGIEETVCKRIIALVRYRKELG